LNLDDVIEFANEASDQIGKYKLEVILSPNHLRSNDYVINNLNWESIAYGKDELDSIPDNKRGVYAFVVSAPSAVLPPHGYVLYIGIAGRDSRRSLRARYKDYLNQKKIMKRERIARMIGHWHEVLRFFFVPLDDDVSNEDIQRLEQQLNTALIPPFSFGDLEAETKRKRRAFT